MTKLKWCMVGGGEGSQIGPAHRLGALADGHFEFAAGALDHRPEVGRAYAQKLGIAEDRAYGDWTEMLDGEKDRADRIDLVIVNLLRSLAPQILDDCIRQDAGAV